MMRRTYLKEHRSANYSLYILEDRLTAHLHAVYTQVPEDINYEDSWLYDKDGEKIEEGYAYELMAFNEKGEQREVSSTLVLEQSEVEESQIPQKALEKMKSDS